MRSFDWFPQAHGLNFESHRFDSRADLHHFEASFRSAEALQQPAGVIQSIGKLGEPATPAECRIFIWYSNHLTPRNFSRSVLARVSFALSRLRSGAEIV